MFPIPNNFLLKTRSLLSSYSSVWGSFDVMDNGILLAGMLVTFGAIVIFSIKAYFWLSASGEVASEEIIEENTKKNVTELDLSERSVERPLDKRVDYHPRDAQGRLDQINSSLEEPSKFLAGQSFYEFRRALSIALKNNESLLQVVSNAVRSRIDHLELVDAVSGPLPKGPAYDFDALENYHLAIECAALVVNVQRADEHYLLLREGLATNQPIYDLDGTQQVEPGAKREQAFLGLVSKVSAHRNFYDLAMEEFSFNISESDFRAITSVLFSSDPDMVDIVHEHLSLVVHYRQFKEVSTKDFDDFYKSRDTRGADDTFSIGVGTRALIYQDLFNIFRAIEKGGAEDYSMLENGLTLENLAKVKTFYFERYTKLANSLVCPRLDNKAKRDDEAVAAIGGEYYVTPFGYPMSNLVRHDPEGTLINSIVGPACISFSSFDQLQTMYYNWHRKCEKFYNLKGSPGITKSEHTLGDINEKANLALKTRATLLECAYRVSPLSQRVRGDVRPANQILWERISYRRSLIPYGRIEAALKHQEPDGRHLLTQERSALSNADELSLESKFSFRLSSPAEGFETGFFSELAEFKEAFSLIVKVIREFF